MRFLALCLALSLPGLADSLMLNSSAVNTSLFTVSSFLSNATDPLATVALADGSIAVGESTGIFRYTDVNHNGVADGAGSLLYAVSGVVHTGLAQAGSFYVDAETSGNTPSIQFLKAGATPADPLAAAGSLQFGFAPNWEHDQMGIAVRPTPGTPGSYDVVFNVGSEYDHQTSTDPVSISGLIKGTVSGDSLYAVTVDLSGATPVASNLRQIASGIRNVIGMGFQPGTGDFYFADNAIDGPGADGDEPPQAEEINRILAADFGVGAPPDFGYPNCYIQYRTGAQIGSGCVQPFFAIQPIPNGTPLGSESEGVTQIAFAPANFPAGFNNGIFLGFSGKGDITGPANEENAVGYYDFTTGTYVHFSENSQTGVYQPAGMMTTADALYITDLHGDVYEVTASAPEPMPAVAIAAALLALTVMRAREKRRRG
jgi:hypothetical protein